MIKNYIKTDSNYQLFRLAKKDLYTQIEQDSRLAKIVENTSSYFRLQNRENKDKKKEVPEKAIKRFLAWRIFTNYEGDLNLFLQSAPNNELPKIIYEDFQMFEG